MFVVRLNVKSELFPVCNTAINNTTSTQVWTTCWH